MTRDTSAGRTGGAGTPDTPETGAARDASTHPASEAGATGRHGGPPGTIATGDRTGPGTEGTVRDPSITMAAQDAHWRRSFASREYTADDREYEYYRPAYKYGWEARTRYGAERFEDVEDRLRSDWKSAERDLDWDEARPAIRDAWHRAGGSTGETGSGNPLA